MYEDAVAAEVMEWWIAAFPRDFSPVEAHQLQVPYPDLPGSKCDLVFSTDGDWTNPEWAVEVKRIQLVGDNGNNNDYGLAKMLSPYLKDRSLIHDIRRLRRFPFARRHAVVGYVFSYDFGLVFESENHHPGATEVLANLYKVLRVNDRANGTLDGAELVAAANSIFVSQGIVKGPVITQEFEGLWRHPCGGNGLVFGWEVEPEDLAARTLFDLE